MSYTFKQADKIKHDIQNFKISRILIKGHFVNSKNKKESVLIQISDELGFFLDARFCKTDNYTLDAIIGIIPEYDYSITKLHKENNVYESNREKGSEIIKILETSLKNIL